MWRLALPTIIGVIALAVLTTGETSSWLVAVPLTLYGLGLSLASAQFTSTVLRDVPKEEPGPGLAVQSTVRKIGTALVGAILSIGMAARWPARLSGVDIDGSDADAVSDATRWALIVAVIFLALGFIGAVRIRKQDPSRKASTR